MKTYKIYIIAIICFVIIGGGWWFLSSYGEWGKPVITFDQELNAVGKHKAVQMILTDESRGLRSISVSISQDNQEQILSSKIYPGPGTQEEKLALTIDPIALKLHNGPAIFNVTVVDYSIWKNKTIFTKQITIDMTPPQINLFNTTNHINSGGSCVIVYGTSEPVVSTEVKVGNIIFPGYPGTISGKPCFISFFAQTLEASREKTSIKVSAKDAAGNETTVNVPHLLTTKKYHSDKMTLPESFLQKKMPEFQAQIPFLQGKAPVEVFMYINSLLREDNLKTIQEICQKSSSKQLWHGAFLRMKDAAPMAHFGDQRSFIYEGKVVGVSTHLGIDLASIAHAPIEAANSGLVIFTGNLGIYGNTVIIDHGLGLFSLYSHMDAVQATKGQEVKKGDTIGQSGTSGLAGGDHLHFSIIIGGQFVNPQEWWDAHWIADNVTKKLEVSF